MKYRILKKSFLGQTRYAVQVKYWFLPVWFDTVKKIAGFSVPNVFSSSKDAYECMDDYVIARDEKAPRVESEVIAVD